jgi:hypothetical protein
MRSFDLIRVSVPCVALILAACAGPVVRDDAPLTPASTIPMSTTPLHSAAHADLLGAGLGLEGLRALQPPPFADPSAPSAAAARSGPTGAASPTSRRAAVSATSTARSRRSPDASSTR